MNNDDLLDLFAGMVAIGMATKNLSDEVIAIRCYNLAEALINEKEKRNERNRSEQSN